MAFAIFSSFFFYFQGNLVYTAVSSNHHVYQHNGINEKSKSAAVSRLERLDMYKERYNYHPPKNHHNHTKIDEICGLSPNYEKYFSYNTFSRSSSDEDKIIYELFFKNGEAKGSVVEMGAFTGIQESNSRFFDLCLGWETLLVEGMPKSFEQVITNRPNSHNFNFVPSCSEADEIANKTVKFDNYPMTNAGINDGNVSTAYTGKNWTVDVPCGSLDKVLLDVFPSGHVSFFSLDVEGSEPSVLRALDFTKYSLKS